MEINTYYGRCVCCFNFGYLRNMWEEYYWEGEKEIYVEMIVDCFGLSWEPADEPMKRDKICENCIKRLRDAINFKNAILYTQSWLHNMDNAQERKSKMEQTAVESNYGSDRESTADSCVYIELPDDSQEDLTDANIADTYDPSDINLNDGNNTDMGDLNESVLYDDGKYLDNRNDTNQNDLSDVDGDDSKDLDEVKTEYEEVEYLEDEDIKEFFESQKSNKKPPSILNNKRPTRNVSRSKKRSSKKRSSKMYTKKDLEACLDVVIKRELTLKEASEKFNVPRSTITAKRRSMGIWCDKRRPEVKNNKKETITIEKNPKKRILKSQRILYRQYTDEDLKNCLEVLENKELTLKKACIKYNIPPSTITAIRRSKAKNVQKSENPSQNKKYGSHKRRGYEFKVKANVRNILQYSNATPFKGYWGVGYACSYCSYQNPSAAALKRHTLKKHDGVLEAFNVTISFLDMMVKLDITGLKCKICSEIFSFLDKFMIHLKLTHDVEIHLDLKEKNIIPYKFDTDQLSCAICDKPFEHFKFLTEHMSDHFRNFECDICGRGFIYEKSLGVHRPRHDIGVFKCTYCDKVFNTRLNMKAHERVLHIKASRTRKCRFCDERFMDSVQKSKHEVSVHGAEIPSYECKACSKIFFSTLALKSHEKRFHLLLRPNKCAICGKSFYYKHDLKKHQIRHTGAKNYQCDICHKWYSSRDSITNHMRIHLDDRRYKCEQCEMAFVQKCSLLMHIKNKHFSYIQE